MASINEKQTIDQALANPVVTNREDEQQPPLYSPVREAKTEPKIDALVPPLLSQGPSKSASSSATALKPTETAPGPITSQPLAKPAPGQSVYDSWNPADASNKDGRPPWWNRWFCCGYGVGCVLCLCGSPTCWQERQKQVVPQVEGQGKEGEKRF